VTSPARRQSFPGVAFSAAPRAGDPASDAPCRAPRPPIAERPRSARTASTTLASTRAASPIRGAFHRQVLSYRFREREPATVPIALPPRAGFRRSFAPQRCSRREELDPDGGDGLFTRGRPDRAPLANFCNRNEMRAQSLDRSSPAHHTEVAFGAAFVAGGQGPFRSSAGRDNTGQGRLGVNHTRASSHHDHSRWKLYPNPIGSGTSCRKPASAGGWRSLRRRCALHLRDIHRSAGPGPAFAKPRRLGPPHTLPREGKRITPHPRCLPSTGPPPKELGSPHQLSVTRKWRSGDPAPFHSSRILLP